MIHAELSLTVDSEKCIQRPKTHTTRSSATAEEQHVSCHM